MKRLITFLLTFTMIISASLTVSAINFEASNSFEAEELTLAKVQGKQLLQKALPSAEERLISLQQRRAEE